MRERAAAFNKINMRRVAILGVGRGEVKSDDVERLSAKAYEETISALTTPQAEG